MKILQKMKATKDLKNQILNPSKTQPNLKLWQQKMFSKENKLNLTQKKKKLKNSIGNSHL